MHEMRLRSIYRKKYIPIYILVVAVSWKLAFDIGEDLNFEVFELIFIDVDRIRLLIIGF
jgi:hypothetical protein